ncbi:cyclic di-GMP phosphodiesterase response regulator RpfG [bacterium BMS3Abin01]|nr:cyclic di-GMP phosphodiesterase response regulator RpfG [bacterium BMS3Abin01]
MNEAVFSLARTPAEGVTGAGKGKNSWHTSVLTIILTLGTLGIIQVLLVRTHLPREIYYLGYFIPIGIAAMHLSWRSAVEVSVLSVIVYLVAVGPSFVVPGADMTELVTEAVGHAALFLAAGIGLSTYHYKINEERNKALNAEKERTQRLQLMLAVSTTVSSSLKLDQVLQELAVRIAEATEATFCRISLLDETRDHLRVVAAYPVREMDWEPSIGRALSLEDLPDHKKAIDTREAVIVGGRRRVPERDISDQQRRMMGEASSLLLYPLVVDGKAVGVVCIGEQRKWERSPLNPEKTAICQTIVNHGAKAVAHAFTHEALEETFLGTIRSLAEAIDAKDPSTRGHSDWVAKYAVMISRQLELSEKEVEMIRFAGYLHDVGKIGISDRILGKPSQLDPDQWKMMKKHASLGAKILEPVKISSAIKAAVRHHHERYDGKGYPGGLSGEAIPPGARTLAVADAYEAMTADRPYRKALNDEQAVEELKRCSGTQFDPLVVQAFLKALGRVSTRIPEADIEAAAV